MVIMAILCFIMIIYWRLAIIFYFWISYLCVKKIPAVVPADSSLATSRNPLSFLKDFTREVEKSYELKFYIGTIAWYWLMGGVFGFFAKDFAAEILSVQSLIPRMPSGSCSAAAWEIWLKRLKTRSSYATRISRTSLSQPCRGMPESWYAAILIT